MVTDAEGKKIIIFEIKIRDFFSFKKESEVEWYNTSFILLVLRRDLLDENEAQQGHSCGADTALGVTGCTEGYLDGPYDIGYSRIERYMDTTPQYTENGFVGKYGMKAQAMSSRSNKLESLAQGISIRS